MSMRDNIGYLLQHTAVGLARQVDETLLDQMGFGYSQFKILMVLEGDPGIRQRDIADNLGQTEASVSRQIKNMHELGLLRTITNQKNKREHIVRFSAYGVRSLEKAKQILNVYYSPVLERLSEHEQRQLHAILNRIHDSTCAASRTGRCI